MALDFSLRTFGDHALEFSLRSMRDRASVDGHGLRPALEKIGYRMLDDEERLFQSSGRTGGHPWKPLARSTRVQKAKKGQPLKPLIATGHLMRSFSDRREPDNIFRLTDIYVIIGSSAPQADLMAEGTEHMPARPPLMFTRLQQDYYYKILSDWVFEGRLPRNA